MADVLIITDRERISAIFRNGQERGRYRLRTVATLAQAEEEIAASRPTHAFAQGNLSGLSGVEVMHHLKRLLPAETRVTLLADDAGTVETLRGDALDLSQPAAALEAAIESRVADAGAGTPAPEIKAAPAGTVKDLLFSADHDPEERGTGKRKAVYAGLAAAVGISLGVAAYHFAGETEKASPPEAAAPSPAHAAHAAAGTAMVPPTAGPAVEYLVQPGDNIMKILTQRFGLSDAEGLRLMGQIERLNGIDGRSLLTPGQKLLLPEGVKKKSQP